MNRDSEFYKGLIGLAGKDRRMQLSLDEAIEDHDNFISSTMSEIDRQIFLLGALASKHSDCFWAACDSVKEDKDKENYTYIGTRVRHHNGSLQMEWFKNNIVLVKKTGKKQTFSGHLAKGKGFRYPSDLFKKEPKWARETIRQVEDGYENIRKRVALLSNIKRDLKTYNSLAKKDFALSAGVSQDDET
ncbi:conjugative transfer protein MobI(A/C) [Marinomonas algarum]|uniref:Uncharacterized protein n=1 Tax=Marinomonas algarum TaxID=2883105 RepID=A0A9X1LCZ6_9GAMM|nr:conjugative transfer protein MobI(A/C) [Marinomonas algarum]MCB5162614.1 hypothetical protein [Marinomonas algarum]